MVVREVAGSRTAAVLGFDLAAVVIAAGAITIGTMGVTEAVIAAAVVVTTAAGDVVVALDFVGSAELRRCRILVRVHSLERIVYS